MSENYWKTAKFKKQLSTWNKKLAKSGLIDVENGHLDDPMLKTWDDKYFRRRFTKDTAEARETYYRQAFQFANNYTFDNKLDKLVWTAHAEGSSYRDIAKCYKINKDKVNTIINRISEACFGSRNKKV